MRRRNFLKTSHVRRYKADRYKNPYFSGKKIVPWTKRFLYILVLLCIVIGIPWLFIRLPWFSIQTITVNGSITLEPDQIESFAWQELEKKRWDVIPQDHIWLLRTASLREDLLETFSLTDVLIERSGRTLQITVQERITSLIWASNDALYFVDQNGSVVRTLTEEEVFDVQALLYGEGERRGVIQSEEVFVVFAQGGGEVSQNQSVVTPEAVQVLSVFHERVEQYMIEIDGIEMQEALSDWAIVKIRNGFDIYITLHGDGLEQLSNLEIILQEYQGDVGDIEYIDLRFGNRVFVK